MKSIKYTLLLFFAFYQSFGIAQSFKKLFLGKDYFLYKGALVQIDKEANSAGFIYSFYSEVKYCQSVADGNVIYPVIKPGLTTSSETNKDSLTGRTFRVEDIITKSGDQIWENYKETDQPLFVLRDTISRQIIFFKYDVSNEANFPFLVKNAQNWESMLCGNIKREKDDFEDEVTIRSPYYEGDEKNFVSITKVITPKQTIYYLSLETVGRTPVVDGKNAYILFTDGTKLMKPEKIDVRVNSSGQYAYSAFIQLTAADLATFGSKTIVKFKLYIFEQDVSGKEAEKFKVYINCIKRAK